MMLYSTGLRENLRWCSDEIMMSFLLRVVFTHRYSVFPRHPQDLEHRADRLANIHASFSPPRGKAVQTEARIRTDERVSSSCTPLRSGWELTGAGTVG